MLLGQLFLLNFIVFSFLVIMSLVRRDGKVIRNIVIAGISLIVFFVIGNPDTDKNEIVKDDDPQEVKINKNKKLKRAEGPIPDPITYKGSGDDVIDIEKTEIGPIVLFINGNQDSDSKSFTIQGYDNKDKKTHRFLNTNDPYEGYTLDAVGTTSLLDINASGSWEVETHSIRSMEKVEFPGKLTGSNDAVFILEEEVSRATIEGNTDPSVSSPYLKIKGHELSTDKDDFINYLLVDVSDDNYQGKVKVDNYIEILTIETEGPWSIDLK